jgi:hypothetical protein
MGRGVSYTPYRSAGTTLMIGEVLVGEDNPAFEGVFEFCSISAGGSIGISIPPSQSHSRLIDYHPQAQPVE